MDYDTADALQAALEDLMRPLATLAPLAPPLRPLRFRTLPHMPLRPLRSPHAMQAELKALGLYVDDKKRSYGTAK
jgi:hypothetical protein